MADRLNIPTVTTPKQKYFIKNDLFGATKLCIEYSEMIFCVGNFLV